MNKIVSFVRKNGLTLIGIPVGALGGYLYWYYIGCQTGSCPITSSPVDSTLWGAFLCAIIFNAFQKNNNNKGYK